MPSLNELSQKDVENVFSYTLKKMTVEELLDAFKETFKQLYNLNGYEGGWQSNAIDAAVKNYIAKTDAIKEDYRAKKIIHIQASSMTIVGAILSFTPLAPVGWGLAGAGTATNAITDVVDLLDKSKQENWNIAKDKLKSFVEDPYQGTTFKIVYQSLMTSYAKIRQRVSVDDYSILLQGLGWNYFLFRKHGMSHEDVVEKELKGMLELFRTEKYTISDDLRMGDTEAIQNIQNKIKPSCDSLLRTLGTLGMIGFASGLSIAAITMGIKIASGTFRFAETIAKGMLAIGNVASASLNLMLKYAPVVSIIGGVVSIVFSAIDLANIDKVFKPYYDFKDECVKLLDESRIQYLRNNDVIVEMIKFMNEEKSAVLPAY